jgi:hypothetical protein
MNRKKLFAVIISFAMAVCMVLPCALAVAADQDPATDEFSVNDEATISVMEETPEEEGEETPMPEEMPEEEGEENPMPEETPEEEGEENPMPEETPEEDQEGEESPALGEMPAEVEYPAETDDQEDCTCDPKPAEGEAHMEGCPLYVAPEAGLSSLYERLMACGTLEELFILIEATPEAELMQLSESEVAAVEAKITALEPEPLPPLVIEESTDVPVESEIVYPAVNFDNVAPFGDPVVGGAD